MFDGAVAEPPVVPVSEGFDTATLQQHQTVVVSSRHCNRVATQRHRALQRRQTALLVTYILSGAVAELAVGPEAESPHRAIGQQHQAVSVSRRHLRGRHLQPPATSCCVRHRHGCVERRRKQSLAGRPVPCLGQRPCTSCPGWAHVQSRVGARLARATDLRGSPVRDVERWQGRRGAARSGVSQAGRARHRLSQHSGQRCEGDEVRCCSAADGGWRVTQPWPSACQSEHATPRVWSREHPGAGVIRGRVCRLPGQLRRRAEFSRSRSASGKATLPCCGMHARAGSCRAEEPGRQARRRGLEARLDLSSRAHARVVRAMSSTARSGAGAFLPVPCRKACDEVIEP